MDTILIQEARVRDIPGIMTLREQNLHRYEKRGAPTLFPDHDTILTRTMGSIGQPFCFCGVALDREKVVGCLLLRILECPLNRGALIAVQEVFVIDPIYRGLGFAKQLLEKGETWAWDNGVSGILLAYRADEPHADWFERQSYRPLETYVVKERAR